jgi:hypothetical protein
VPAGLPPRPVFDCPVGGRELNCVSLEWVVIIPVRDSYLVSNSRLARL